MSTYVVTANYADVQALELGLAPGTATKVMDSQYLWQ
jgi:hypothetical protein